MFQLPEIHGAAGGLANVEGLAKIRGVWAKNGGVWAKIEKVDKECMFVAVATSVAVTKKMVAKGRKARNKIKSIQDTTAWRTPFVWPKMCSQTLSKIGSNSLG